MSTERARGLRRRSTEAEKLLWRRLRARDLGGEKFRRQVPIGPYYVDFVAFEPRLVIEVDGGQHADDGPERTRYLEAEGFRILRFWNNEVLRNTDGVLRTILAAIEAG
jgi:very-short-patch-repair endonuclease